MASSGWESGFHPSVLLLRDSRHVPLCSVSFPGHAPISLLLWEVSVRGCRQIRLLVFALRRSHHPSISALSRLEIARFLGLCLRQRRSCFSPSFLTDLLFARRMLSTPSDRFHRGVIDYRHRSSFLRQFVFWMAKSTSSSALLSSMRFPMDFPGLRLSRIVPQWSGLASVRSCQPSRALRFASRSSRYCLRALA